MHEKHFCDFCRDTGIITIEDGDEVIEKECWHCQSDRDPFENWKEIEEDENKKLNDFELEK